MSRTKSAFLGIISSQLYTIIGVLFALVSVPIIIRHLSSEIYGLSVIIFQVTSYLGLFDFGLSAGVDKYLAGTRNDNDENREIIKKIISTSLVVYSIIALFIAIAGNIFAPFAQTVFNAPQSYKYDIHFIISTISILLGLQLILRVIGSIFFAHQRQLLSNTLSFILSISNTVLTVIFVCLNFGLWSFVYSQVISFVINAIFNIYYLRKHYNYLEFKIRYFDSTLLKKMLSYGFSLFLISVSVQVIFQTDRILVGSFISLTAVALYSISTKVPELITQFLWKITDNSFPAIVEISSEKDSSAFTAVHNRLMNITISLSSIVFWVVLVASYPFIKLWVGGKYYVSDVFLLLTLYLYLIQHTFIHVTAMCLNAAGIANKIAFMYVLEAALNVLLSIILIKQYQILGVILGTIISGALTSVWFVPYLAIKYMKTNVYIYIKTIVIPLAVESLVGGALYLASKKMFLRIDNWLQLILYSFLFSVIALLPVIFMNRSFFISMILKIKAKQ